ncbi:UNVERIFIED_ORG: phage-related minor tail protein [Variovorax guangxiensis]
MAAIQQTSFQMMVSATVANADISRVVGEVSKAIDKALSGASKAEEAKAKAESAAKEAEEKAKAAIEKVSSSVDSLYASLKSGQSPLTSFVGEGAKLVSSFGGIGPALGGVAAYAKDLVSPLNLATRAVTMLTEAYVEGRKEASQFSNANTLTGNYSGLTSDELQTKAIEIAGTKGTRAKAAEAVTAVVNTGRIGGDVVGEVAGATAEMNRVLGTSIDDAVSNFVKLADEPSKASAKLNETYHYLSASTYERIVALEKQGKKEEAAALAQKTFAAAMKERTAEVVANLGSLERGWLSITGFAQKAWDAMLNIGRPITLQQQLDTVNKEISQITQLKQGGGFVSNGGGAAFGRGKAGAAQDKALEDAEARKAILEESRRMSSSAALRKADDARTQQARIAKTEEKEEGKGKRTGTGSSGIGRAEDDNLRMSIEAIREEYNAKARVTAEGFKNIDSLRKRDLLDDYAVVRQKRDLRLKDLKDQEDAIQAELRLLGTKKGSAADRQKLEQRSKVVEQQRGFVNDEADRSYAELDAVPRNAVLKTSQQAVDRIREQTRALEEQNVVYGLSKEEIQKLNIVQLERQIRELDATENVDPAYIQSLQDRLKAERDLLQVSQKSESLKAADEKQKKDKEKDKDAAKKMSDDIGGVFRDGFVNLLEGGGQGAINKMGEALKKKLVKSLADAFYDATLKDAVEGFSGWLTGALKGSSGAGSKSGGGSSSGIGGLIGAVAGLFSGGWTSASAGISNMLGGDTLGTFISLNGWANAKGNVFASPGLHAYANSVVGQPTFFPFANGIGLMGEAGPEAIMPLRRGSDGRLGVSAPGGGGNAVPTIQFAPSNVFHIDARSDRGAVMADMQRLLAENNRGQMEQLKRVKVLPQ